MFNRWASCAAGVLIIEILIAAMAWGQGVPATKINAVHSAFNLPQLQQDIQQVRGAKDRRPVALAKGWAALFQQRASASMAWHSNAKGEPLLLELSAGDAERSSEDLLVVVPLHGEERGVVATSNLLQLVTALSEVPSASLVREVRLFLELRPGGMLEWIEHCDWQTEEALMAIRFAETGGDSLQLKLRSLHRSHGFGHLTEWLVQRGGEKGAVSQLPRLPSEGTDPYGVRLGFALLSAELSTPKSLSVNTLNAIGRQFCQLILQVAMADDAALRSTQAHAEGAASVRLAAAFRDALSFLVTSEIKPTTRLRVAFDHVAFSAADLAESMTALGELARTNATREAAGSSAEQIAAASNRYANRLLQAARSCFAEGPPTMPLSAPESHAAQVIGYVNDRPGEALAARRSLLAKSRDPRVAAQILDLVDGKRSAWHIFETLRIGRLMQGHGVRVSVDQVVEVLRRAKAAGVLMDESLR